MTPSYESPLGQAVALLRAGNTVPFSLRRELTEQGYDFSALQAAHYLQKA